MTRLTIVTWNIAGGHTENSHGQFDYNPEEDAQYFIDRLTEKQADIIFLQESHWHAENSLTKRIAEALNMHYFETAMSPSHIDPGFHLANAILSRKPLANATAVQLAYPSFPLRFSDGRPAERHEKYLQLAEYDSFQVANIHTQPLAIFGHSYATGEGLAYLHEIETQLQENLHAPLILAGVLNAEGTEQLMPRLIGGLNLRDTLPGKPNRSKGVHIDYLFASPEFSVIASGIDKTNSDHYLCWAKLRTV